MIEVLKVASADGAQLHTEVLLPDVTPAPTVLVRTPYEAASHRTEARGWNRRGYAVVIQDVRGRYGSTGCWAPYVHESIDGGVAIDAILDASWCDGRVVCHGVSYGAHCAVTAAVARPQRVAAVVAAVPALSLRRVARDRNGTPRLYGHAWWWLQHGDGPRSRPCPIHGATASTPGPMAGLPALDIAEAGDVASDTLTEPWRVGGVPDSSATNLDPPLSAYPADLPPLLTIGGLHDVFRDDALDLADCWPAHADAVIGAWQHDLGLVQRLGNGDLQRADGHTRNVGRLIIEWLEHVLDTRRGLSSPRRWLALEGTDGWAQADPGRLPHAVSLSAVRRTFDADPCDPHPSLLGPVDLGEVNQREDHARFISQPFGELMDLAGAPRVVIQGLHAIDVDGEPITGPVDWAVRLVWHPADADRAETGASTVQVAHGLVRTAGTAATITLPLLCRRMHPGARLEVQVSAHQFPLYARDPQDGSEPLAATRLHRAHRTVDTVELHVTMARDTDPPFVRRHEDRL